MKGGLGGGRSLEIELEAMAKIALNLNNAASLTRIEQKDGRSGLSSAPGSTRAMDVGVRITRGLVLDDKVNVLDVNTTSSDIGRHEDVEGARAEGCEGGVALLLTDIAVKSLGGQRLEDAARNELIGLALGLHKDDGLAKDLLVEMSTLLLLGGDRSGSDGVLIFILLAIADGSIGNGLELLLDALGNLNGDDIFEDGPLGLITGGDLQSNVLHSRGGTRGSISILGGGVDGEDILLVLPPDLLHPRRGGGRKEEALRLLGISRANTLKDDLHILGESHIEHFIRLIEDGNLTFGKVEVAPIEVVHNSTGGANEDIQTGTEGTGLRTVRNTAMEAGGEQTERLADGADLLFDLPGQLPGGTEDDHGNAATALHPAAGVHGALLLGHLNDASCGRHTKGEGLASTGTRTADDVPTGHDGHEGLGLDGG
mmetsp:Transcript_10182/g.28571  ORF Transcript_10182/g.28571 Transcript_10182/m.28571 type:complete len:427 (-) Transcript_10182:880-2160(-)